MWGLPLIQTPAVAAGTVLVLDPMQAAILDRWSPRVELGRDADDFTRNLLTIRGEIRVGLAVFSPAAVLKVTLA